MVQRASSLFISPSGSLFTGSDGHMARKCGRPSAGGTYEGSRGMPLIIVATPSQMPQRCRIKTHAQTFTFPYFWQKVDVCAWVCPARGLSNEREAGFPPVLPHTHAHCPVKANRPETDRFPACVDSGAPDTIRTYDTRFRRAVLYPLSY